MCGIAGISFRQPHRGADPLLRAMTETLHHRGPDSSGYVSLDQGRVWLGFRRLAIRDLRGVADQPMRSASGQTTVIFNGEIYNTDDLRDQFCRNAILRTTGDTEVLMEAFEHYGSSIFPHCNGMFAVVFYDHAKQTLTLARDRMGKKPLYVYEGDQFLAFASEIRALRAFGLDLDPEQAGYYFHFGYVPAPHTFYKRLTQVCPGEEIVVRHGVKIASRRFFQFTEIPWGHKRHIDWHEVAHSLDRAVSLRRISDVPIAAFLSGGVDSSLIMSHLVRGGSRIPTFTIAFDDPKKDESHYAAEIASYLGIPHKRIPVDRHSMVDLVDDYLDCYEQPFADTSGLPALVLCREVKRFATVALSGDGGDEFFTGYKRYAWFQKALLAQRLPFIARKALGTLAAATITRQGHRIEQWLRSADEASLYSAIVCQWTGGSIRDLLPNVPEVEHRPVELVRAVFDHVSGDAFSKAACFDACYYIPDDLQVKLDRASMWSSLEVRCPLLDFNVAQLGAELATSIKWRRGLKTVLRQALGKHIPRRLFERPKQGFSVPLVRWLCGPLAGRVEESLRGRTLRECGWLNCNEIDRVWRQFQAGHQELAHCIWMAWVVARRLELDQSRSAYYQPYIAQGQNLLEMAPDASGQFG
ncbi:MAG: asparagine synthase (glutamine-hydrolyzing) [Pirellulales bacterium]|nr:asparagine synthase (glutamine-hydrolyzing) [Pirellulales bacterium]